MSHLSLRISTICLLACLASTAAEDTWTKIRELKTGTEIRIFKRGAKQPLEARMDEANDERVVVILKNEQTSIARQEIDRLDYRPEQKSGRVTRESKTETTLPAETPSGPRPNYSSGAPSTSSSSGLSFGSKPGFETLYTRPTAPPR